MASNPRPVTNHNSIALAADAPARPGLRYHGSKWLLMPWTLSLLPSDHDVYVSGFAGSFADILRKTRSRIEVANDLDGDVMNYFEVLRTRKAELVEQILYTPFHYGEYRRAQEPADDPLERARRLYIRSYMAIAGPTAQWYTGWRRQKVFSRGRRGNSKMTPASATFFNVAHFDAIAERLRGVTFEMMPALDLIRLYDGPRTLFYLDPPYHPDTRSKWATKAYQHEMTHSDHVALLEEIGRCAGMVAIAGYRCPLYDDALDVWTRYDRRSRVNNNSFRVESLWLNPAAEVALRSLPLFTAQSFFGPDGSGTFPDEEE